MHTVSLSLTKHEYSKLKARAERAALPLVAYIISASSNPIKCAWPEDAEEPIAEVKP